MVYDWLPSSTKSSTPVIVTVWFVLQFDGVKVRVEGETAPSAGLLEVSAMVTLAVGFEFSLTVNVAEPPASVVIKPLIGETIMPASSSSIFTTDTSEAFVPLYLVSVLVAGAVTMV